MAVRVPGSRPRRAGQIDVLVFRRAGTGRRGAEVFPAERCSVFEGEARGCPDAAAVYPPAGPDEADPLAAVAPKRRAVNCQIIRSRLSPSN